MTISIHIEGHTADHVRAEMAKLLGASLDGIPVTGKVPQPADEKLDLDAVAEEINTATRQMIAEYDERNATDGVDPARQTVAHTPKPTRERGKPSAGHARRTKAEIAEDDVVLNVAKAAGPITVVSQTGVTADEIPLISTGEERIGPEDDKATAAADAADEAAESAAAKQANGGKLTTEDVRNAMGVYVQKYGFEAIQTDGLEVFNRVLGACPLKNEKGDARTWKVSDLPDDQAVLGKLVAGFNEMTTKNPFSRERKPSSLAGS